MSAAGFNDILQQSMVSDFLPAGRQDTKCSVNSANGLMHTQ